MVSFLNLLCLNIVAQNFELDENKQIFSNMFTEEEYRTSTSVAPLCTDKLSWNVANSAEELKAQRECKSEGTYSNNRCSDRQLNSFVRSRDEEDIPLTALTIDFFDDYRFHLKKKGYAPATINSHLC